MTDEEPAVTEEELNGDELQDRVWAILAAVAEDRQADVDELLVTLRWPDLVTLVYGIGHVCVTYLAGGLDSALGDAERARIAALMREMLIERAAGRDDG